MAVFLNTFSKEIFIIASVILVSLISLVGIFMLSLNEKRLNRVVIVMISLAVGALLGDVFIHLLPESLNEQGKLRTFVLVVFGLLSFFALEKYLIWRNLKNKKNIHPVGHMSLFADGLHNFTDGFVIGAAYLASIPLGLATTLAVVFHEVPQEIGEFGVLLKAGFSKSQALFFNFVSASLAIIGAIIAILIGISFKGITVLVVAFAAGAYIYIVGSGLIPILRREAGSSKVSVLFLAFGVGVGVMLLIACVG